MSSYNMPTGTPLAVLSRTSRKPGPKRERSASMRWPYIGSTSSAALDRNRSSAGSRMASAIDSSRKCPDPVTHQAKRERAGSGALAQVACETSMWSLWSLR